MATMKINDVEIEISEKLRRFFVLAFINASPKDFSQFEDHTDYEFPARFIVDGTKFDFGYESK